MNTNRLLHSLIAIVILGCSESPSGPKLDPQDILEEGDQVLIVDRTGKQWDVTHASAKYGMESSKFQFGLGPDAIKPILEPKMLVEGDPGYPSNSDESLVLGVNLEGKARAYLLRRLVRREVVDEKFGDTYVAIGYCFLVDLAALYRRELDGEVLTLASSGWTYADTFVLYDRETESLWYPLQGTPGLTCISGQYADRKLEELPSMKTRWSFWKARNPNTKYLDPRSQ